ncbi:hypothetical protein ETU08_00200 [Apibacter muscae]|uniref:hypothetical protein n=1 Tax=Apibacter muscae TaxID=2509004 RepID=UPI0011ABEEEC|nr:hypothetical protein [Apibacter muscae]TWP31914.1 hypothetical protein ETU08_00200 [Apibacter muscae]
MKIVETQPFIHEFNITGNENNLPEILKHFNTPEECHEYFSSNLIAEHTKLYVDRVYTEEEITEFEDNILDIVKNQMPDAENKISDAEYSLQVAKKNKEKAVESYNALNTEIKDYRNEILKGTTELEIEAQRVFRFPYKGYYYHYVYLDNGMVVLAKITLMNEEERNELFSSSDKNEKFINSLLNEEKNKRKTK